MTYRDITFCRASECAKWSTCPRAFTSIEKADAERWWGTPYPPVMFFTNPKELDCYESALPSHEDTIATEEHINEGPR